MELNVLDKDIQDFINDNLNSDIGKLLLSKKEVHNIDIKIIINQIEAKKKSKDKLSTWFNTAQIYYPARLSIEQTSSEITASFKASLFKGNKAIDLTGGFGVDCFYFAKNFEKFTHCEYNSELSEIVKHNFQVLGVKNVDFYSGNSVEYLKNSNSRYDLIYLDPARRSDKKGKVFMFQDTQPNPVELIDLFLEKSDNILIKASPILDIHKSLNDLKNVKSVYIVALEGEVKELLFHIEKSYEAEPEIKCVDLFNSKKTQIISFNNTNEELNLPYSEPLKYLYEPSPALLKSGLFNSIANKYKLHKLAVNTHLYTSEEPVADFQGRSFKIDAVSKVDKKEIKHFLPDGKANISTRNFKIDVPSIKKKFKIKDGGSNYLFFTSLNNNKNIIIYCSKTDNSI